MKLTTYKPRPQDIDWARNLIRCANEGATWGIPRSQIVFKFNKEAKQLIQIGGPTDGETYLNEIDANTAVFAAAGYQVVPMGEAFTPSQGLHWSQFNKRDLS